MAFWKKKDNLIITGFVVLFFVGLAAWFDLCCVRAAFFGGNASSPYQAAFVDQNQKSLTLGSFKGKPLVVNFWATWCPQCVKKMGSLNSFAANFQARGGEVLAISQDKGGISKVRAYYTREGYHNLPIYIDSTGQVLKAFGVRGLPTTIFINAQGQEVGRIVGGFDLESPQAQKMIQDYFGLKISQ